MAKKKEGKLGKEPKTSGNLKKPIGIKSKPKHKHPADHFGKGGEMQIGSKAKKGSATKYDKDKDGM